MVSKRQQQQQQQPPEQRTAASNSTMRFERSSYSSDSCASNGRLVFVLLAITASLFNISMGPQAFVDIPSSSIGYSNGRHLMQGDNDVAVSLRRRRALLYQHQPAQPKSKQEEYLAERECGHHSESYSTFFQQPKEVRSSSNEDKTIYSIFFEGLHPNEMKNMTYVELGAYDGKTESNSRFFDVCLNWKGLLIEANPTAFAHLVKNRPNAERLSFAPSCTIEEEAANKTIGFLSTPRAWTNAAQVGTPNAVSFKEIEPTQVPCGSLTPVLLDYFAGGHVTFFSLDVEGAEALILRNIDFDQVFIEILIAENVNTHCPKNEPCEARRLARETMEAAGYHLFENVVHRSDLYIHQKSSRFLSLAREAVSAAPSTTATNAFKVQPKLQKPPSSLTNKVHVKQAQGTSADKLQVLNHPRSVYKNGRYQYRSAKTRTQHHLQLAERECGNRQDSYSTYFTQSEEVRSSSFEDMTIYSTFFKQLQPQDMKDMTYVELGAYNGMTESNSRFFDVCLGWKGLLIEANPTAFSQLVVNRPHADRMSFAPSCSIEEEFANKTIGFLSAPRAWTNAAQVDTANAAAYSELEPIQVPCGSLTPVLLDLLPNVTFFSLDVEGAEALIVQNIDFDKVFIEILIAENVNAHCKRNEPCESRELTRQRMKEAGYHMFVNVVRRSDLYVHPKSRFLSMAKEAELAIKAALVAKASTASTTTKPGQAPTLSTTRVTHRINGDMAKTTSHGTAAQVQ